MNCNCTATQNHKCVECGNLVYKVENRTCGECKHFRVDLGSNVIGYCESKLMTVTSDLRVTFKVKDGTCFEPINKVKGG